MTDSEKLDLLLKKVVGIEGDISGMKEDITELKADVTELKEEVKRLDQNDTLILNEVERVHHILNKHTA